MRKSGHGDGRSRRAGGERRNVGEVEVVTGNGEFVYGTEDGKVQ